MKKNNKGFTLVELLVTIVIMISILGIAIVSFIKLSDKKKQEALKLVEEQIETAAKEYFTANEYLFEGFTNGTNGTVTVGKLIDEDYLSIVTNPLTGKKISRYVIINVTKTGSSYDANIEDITADNNGYTDISAVVTVTEEGATPGVIKYYKVGYASIGSKYQDWFNEKTLGKDKNLVVCVKPNNSNGIIVSSTIGGKTVTSSTYGYCSTIANGTKADVEFKLVNSSGKVWKTTQNIKVDTTPPTGIMEINSKSTKYFTKEANIDINVKDQGNSGLWKVNFKDKDYTSFSTTNVLTGYQKRLSLTNQTIASSYDGKTYTLPAKVYDNAGNQGNISGSYEVYKECSKVTYEDGNTCSEKCGGGTKNRLAYDEYTKVRCSSEDKSSGGASCNTQGCCSKTTTKWGTWGSCSNVCGGGTKTRTGTKYSDYDESNCGTETDSTSCGGKKKKGDTNWGSYGACDKNNQKTKTGTYATISTEDNKTSCGNEKTSSTTDCDPSDLSCRVRGIEQDCESSSGKHILGRLYVKCNQPVKRIKIHYYYQDGDSKICNGTSASKAVDDIKGGSWTKGSSAKNASYFNFRGCGSTKLRYKVIVTDMNGDDHTWKPSDGWYNFDFSSSSSYSSCNPEAGGRWDD